MRKLLIIMLSAFALTANADEVQIGTWSGSQTGVTNAPIYTYGKSTESESIYEAADLKALQVGDSIRGITWLGYSNSDFTRSSVQVYLENTASTANSTGKTIDKSKATLVYDGAVSFVKGGDGQLSNLFPIMPVTFTKAFEYTGGNLKVIVRSIQTSSGTATCFCDMAESHTVAHKGTTGTDYSLDNTSLASYANPVMKITYTSTGGKVMPKVSGYVSDGVNPVSDATVSLVSDEATLTAKTDFEGKYSFDIANKSVAYSLSVDELGYLPYTSEQFTVSDEGSTQNIALEVAKGFYNVKAKFPETVEINKPFTVTATAVNRLKEDISYYGASVKYGEDEVTSIELMTVPAGKEGSWSITVTPHSTGNIQAYFYLDNGEQFKSEPVVINVLPENMSPDITFADSTALSESVAPWNNNYMKHECEMLYTPKQLNIEAGRVIKSLAFRGRFAEYGSGNEAVKLYIMNTSDDFTTFQAHDVTQMQICLNTSIAYSPEETSTPAHDILYAEFPEGFVYTGENLLVKMVGSRGANDGSKLHFFVVDTDVTGNVYYRYAEQSTDITTQTWNTGKPLPVLYASTLAPHTLSGKVTKAGSPVSGADLTIKAGEVEYYATTAADGSYSAEIGKTGSDYSVLVEYDGDNYVCKETVNLAREDKNFDIELDGTVGLESLSAYSSSLKSNSCYNLAGQRVNNGYKGVQVVSGRKILNR